MQTRTLGTTPLQFSTVGIGTWAIGGGDWMFGWGPQDETEAIRAITTGVALGINWIDTAPVYGAGRSEEIVGKALAEIPANERPYVATKCSRIFQADGTIKGVLKPDSIRAECEESLRRLQVDAIDLYQLHWPDPDQDIEEGWQTLIELREQGKVRQIGVSNHSAAQMRRLQPLHPVASLQPPYNMLARGIEAETLPYCGEQKIGVICYSPMGKGLLTGAFDKARASSLPESDHRSRDPKFQEPLIDVNLRLVDQLKPIAQQRGRTLAQLAIAWVLCRPEVTGAIVGARKPEQIQDTAPAGDWQLSKDEVQQIELLLHQREEQLQLLGPVDSGRV